LQSLFVRCDGREGLKGWIESVVADLYEGMGAQQTGLIAVLTAVLIGGVGAKVIQQ
jgi:hypothetical protein